MSNVLGYILVFVGVFVGYMLIPLMVLVGVAALMGAFMGVVDEDPHMLMTIFGVVCMLTMSFCCFFTAGWMFRHTDDRDPGRYVLVGWVSLVIAALAAYAVHQGMFDAWRTLTDYLIIAGPYGLWAVFNFVRGVRGRRHAESG